MITKVDINMILENDNEVCIIVREHEVGLIIF